jgi:hypothetical protein
MGTMGMPGWCRAIIYCGLMNLTRGRGAKGGRGLCIGVTATVFVTLSDNRGRLTRSPLSGGPFPSLKGVTATVVETDPGALSRLKEEPSSESIEFII